MTLPISVAGTNKPWGNSHSHCRPAIARDFFPGLFFPDLFMQSRLGPREMPALQQQLPLFQLRHHRRLDPRHGRPTRAGRRTRVTHRARTHEHQRGRGIRVHGKARVLKITIKCIFLAGSTGKTECDATCECNGDCTPRAGTFATGSTVAIALRDRGVCVFCAETMRNTCKHRARYCEYRVLPEGLWEMSRSKLLADRDVDP